MRSHVRPVRVLALLALACSPAHAAARDPQVPVSGTALQSFFAAQGQAIDVHAQQLDLQRTSMPTETAFTVHPFGPEAATTSFGLYNAALASPPLYQVMPGSASPGWFVAASFRTAPLRLVVNLFDDTGAFAGYTWFACETGAGPGGDYADAIFLAQLALAPTDVERSTWGALKQRFR